MMMMRILQINTTSVRNKKPQLTRFLVEEKIDIACLSETFLKPADKFEIMNYNVIRKDRQSPTRGGGVAIVLKNNLSFKILPIQLTNGQIEILACVINTQIYDVIIVSVYIPPSVNFGGNDLDDILRKIPANSKIIFCGDFNSHHYSWGCDSTDNKGTIIFDWVEKNNMVILNDGSKTFFGCSNPSSLDLTISSSTLSLISEWKTLNETFGSTHCAIQIDLQLRPKQKVKLSYGVPKNISDLDLNSAMSDIFNSNDFINTKDEEKFDVFSQMFYERFKIKIDPRMYHENPWWNGACNKVKAELLRSMSRFNNRASRKNFLETINTRKKYFYTLRHEKRKGWKKTCEEICCDTTPTELWTIMKKFRGMNIPKPPPLPESCTDSFCDIIAGPIGPINLKMLM